MGEWLVRPPRRPKLPSLPKAPRPPKPVDKLQNLMPLGKLGQTEGVRGHWRFHEETRQWHWVKAHKRKP
jgi:hypothetical protein